MDITDITEFLPKYPNITPYEQDVFNPYDNKFYQNIYKKKEFYDEKLSFQEDFPEQVGNLMKHQKIIARFFSSYTPYDQLLLVHEMGTGKSCSAVGAIETIREQSNMFRGALYLAKGRPLLDNFKNEIAFKCTDGRYIPDNYENLTKRERDGRRDKLLSQFYQFKTFETFAKSAIKDVPDHIIKEKYNNMIIVIDEVHNLREQGKTAGLNIYNQFHRFLHVIEGCKILILSGTPMKDSVDEIASIMNLITPMDKQLPTGQTFINEYFDMEGPEIFKVKQSKKRELKQVFKGKVSFLKAMTSTVPKIYEGEHIGRLRHLKVVPDVMSKFQSLAYKNAYELDRQTDRQGVYSNSRQASLFVFPDNSYGKAGFDKYINERKRKGALVVNDDGKKQQLSNFSLKPELRDALKADSIEEQLENVKKFSTIYAASILNILRAQAEGKCVFVYNELVTGSGMILFGLILELFGFTKASGNEPSKNYKPRYISLSNATSTPAQIKDLIGRFNKPDNVNGKVINVIIGSSVLREGFSFQNIQVEEIQTPWFNYSQLAQAIARGYRLGSHRMLIEQGQKPTLRIYQRVAIPLATVLKREDSIDLRMYQLAEDKDISIKGVERLIKEAAFDCALNYERNHITGLDNQRECEYMNCDYRCDGVPPEMIRNELDTLDYSTYQLYYASENTDRAIELIQELFRTEFSLDFNYLYSYLTKYKFKSFEILTALREMINKNIQITNKYGFKSYLKEENNIFYIVDSLSVIGTLLSDYYTQFPNITQNKTFSQILQPIYYSTLPGIVEEVCQSTDIQTTRRLLLKLPPVINEEFLEAALLADKKKIKKNIPQRELILENFSNYYKDFDGTIVSWYLYQNEDILRCLKGNTWKNCSDDYIARVENLKQEKQQDMEQNPYGYYGQINPTNDNFCIRDVSQDIPDKKHKRTSGKMCATWTAGPLYDLAINKLNMPLPEQKVFMDYLTKMVKKNRKIRMPSDINNKKELWNIVKELKVINTMYTENSLKKLSVNDIHRVIYWGSMQKKPLCEFIKQWFDSKGLLVEDLGCGSVDKPKI